MQSVIYIFNNIAIIFKQVFEGFIEFFNAIPDLFASISRWSSSLFPSEFSTYISVLVPIMITLIVIKFVRG